MRVSFPRSTVAVTAAPSAGKTVILPFCLVLPIEEQPVNNNPIKTDILRITDNEEVLVFMNPASDQGYDDSS